MGENLFEKWNNVQYLNDRVWIGKTRYGKPTAFPDSWSDFLSNRSLTGPFGPPIQRVCSLWQKMAGPSLIFLTNRRMIRFYD
jgi:hypothetical protein